MNSEQKTKSKSKKKTKSKTKKKIPFIIDSTSTIILSPLDEKSTPSKKTKKTKKTKKRKKRKRLFVIETTTSSEPKNEINKKNEINTQMKTDLKITPLNKEMEQHTNNNLPVPNGRLNEPFIELMEQLAGIMLKKGEPFRARAYQKAQETIMSYPGDITSPNDLKGKPGIGDTIMDKLNEYVKTGTLQVLEKEKNNPVNILADVYGIGPKKAKDLVDKGITSISQLRENQHMLNDIQKIGLQYYEDILERIPRSEIEKFKKVFEQAFPKGTNGKMEIVGSYRRGAQTSGDIDVIITSSSKDVFKTFINHLLETNIILHILSRGPTKSLVVAKIPSSNTARRVDFLYTSPDEFPFAILYFTGSKIFNTVMRHVALEKGYTMNEHGIYKMESKKKGDKIDHVFNEEEDIFAFLDLEYKTPVERIDGRSIIKTKPQEPTSTEKPKTKPQEPTPTEKPKTKPKTNISHIANEFKTTGISVLKNLNESQLSELLREANKAYYNEQPFFNDNQYDIIKEYVETTYPNNTIIHEIGAPVERNKVTLPYPMGSMNKIKPDTSALSNWMTKYKGPYVISCKLDGVSGLYTTQGKTPKLYTRGNGIVGQDISHLIPYLRLPKNKNIVIRGEFIIPKVVFNEKYKQTFANPRNMVAGIINQKTINAAIHDLHFVSYELIEPVKSPSEQMTFLLTLDIELVLYTIQESIDNTFLSNVLVDWRTHYDYEIDGVIVTNDEKYERKTGNPDYAFAFKMVLSEQVAEAKVVDVIWSASKDGYLKPRVQIEPLHLGGVQITYATGFNGSFIYNNKIGVGAIIELIRSGDVIPYIRKVIVPAEEPKMPSRPYKWNDTHIDVILEDSELENDETVREKNIMGFFRGIGVEGLSIGNVKRIMDGGYTTIPEILKMDMSDFLKIDGFKEKTASKLYNGIKDKLETTNLVTFMAVSNMFGRGFSEKKIETIMENEPNILLSKESTEMKVQKIAKIKGMANKSAELFVEKIPKFIEFMNAAGLQNKINATQNPISMSNPKLTPNENHILYNKSIVMTGFRDKELEKLLKEYGAKMGTSVSKKTFVVLVKDKTEDTGKANEARKYNIPLMTPQEFSDKYIL
jgi:NAD-dependent DNA ligase